MARKDVTIRSFGELTPEMLGVGAADSTGVPESTEAQQQAQEAGSPAGSNSGEQPTEHTAAPARSTRVSNRDLCDSLVDAGLFTSEGEAFEKCIIAFIKEQNPDKNTSAIYLHTQAQKAVIEYVNTLIAESAASATISDDASEEDDTTGSDHVPDPDDMLGWARGEIDRLLTNEIISSAHHKRWLRDEERAGRITYPHDWDEHDHDQSTLFKQAREQLASQLYTLGGALGVDPQLMWDGEEEHWEDPVLTWCWDASYRLMMATDVRVAVSKLLWPGMEAPKTGAKTPRASAKPPTPIQWRSPAPISSDAPRVEEGVSETQPVDDASPSTETIKDEVKTVKTRAEAEEAIRSHACHWLPICREADRVVGIPEEKWTAGQRRIVDEATDRWYRLSRLLVEYGVQLGCDRTSLGDPERGDIADWCVAAARGVLKSPTGSFNQNIKALDWPGLPVEHQRQVKERPSSKDIADRHEGENRRDASDDDLARKAAARLEPASRQRVTGGGAQPRDTKKSAPQVSTSAPQFAGSPEASPTPSSHPSDEEIAARVERLMRETDLSMEEIFEAALA